MPEDYEVQPGDCMSSIAYEHGFFWKTLWNLGANSALKAQRKNPNVLMRGDIVHIPDLTIKEESGATEQRHKFMLKGAPEKLRMKLLDANHKPRPNVDYTIIIDGKPHKGKTDGSGELIESISPTAKKGKIIIQDQPTPGQTVPPAPEVVILTFGTLDPASEPTGVKARLKNLKYYRPPADGDEDTAMKSAISAFQKDQSLPVTGVADDATKAKLLSVHGH